MGGMEEMSVVQVKFVIKNVETYEEYKQLRKVLHGTRMEEIVAKVYLEAIAETPELRDKLGIKIELMR